MSEIHELELGVHLKLTSGFPFPSSGFAREGIPLIRIRDVLGSRTETFFNGVVPPGYLITFGDILIGMDGDFHVVRWLGPDALLNQRVLKVEVRDESAITLDYLFHLLGPFIKKVNEVTAATTVKHLSTKDLTKAKIRLPSVSSQRKIARVLDCIDTAIEKTEALIAKHQQIKAGLMHDLFTRGVLLNGQLRPPRSEAPELYQETAIGWIPKDWQLLSLRDLVGASNIVNGPFGSDLLTSELRSEGVPVLYVQDVKPGVFTRVSKAHVTARKANELAFCNVRRDDVLAAKVGDPPCDSCVYESDEQAVVTQDVIRVRPTAEAKPAYLAALLNSNFGRKVVKKISIEGTRERVSLTEFKGLVLPIAHPVEQLRIASRVIQMQAAITSEQTKVSKLHSKKLGLMQDLLTGKVPVTVPPEHTGAAA